MKVIHHQSVPVIARWVLVALAIVIVLLIASVAAACPNCKEGLAQNDPQGQSIAAGYYYSILFMLSMPFLIVGSFSGWMYFAVRKARREREAAAASRQQESATADSQEYETVSGPASHA